MSPFVFQTVFLLVFIILLLNHRNIIQKINLYGFWAVDDTVQNFYRNDDVSVKVLALD